MTKLWPVVLSVFMVGCANFEGDEEYFRNRGNDYQSAYLIAPLEIPKDLSSIPSYDQFPVPDAVPEGPTSVQLEPPFYHDEVEES